MADIIKKITWAYLKEGKSVDDIAAEFNLERTKVEKLLKNYISRPKSKGEVSLGPILRKMFPKGKIMEQHSIGNQFFDFYIEIMRVAVEFNGVQHYKPSTLFHGKSESQRQYNFENGVDNDNRKGKLAKESNIYIIWIPYTVKLTEENIRRIFNDHNKQIINNLNQYAAETGLRDK